MKPSKRIQEILEKICKEKGVHPDSEFANTYGYQEVAIIMYLDEVYKKKEELDDFNKRFAVSDAESKLQ